ncbi:MAG: hypothetical protein NUW08_03265, partial [Candidatus Uhrbacteria bacterium]|nr:hypothetical protein [Candidatus Uhrbacteria bacterium]
MDDQTLTLFLIESMTLSFADGIRKVEKSTIPGTSQRVYKRDGLLYLEILSGTNLRRKTGIYVMLEDPVMPVFGMDIVAEFKAGALANRSVVYTDVLRAVHNARLAGFERTRTDIAEGKPFCIFRIPDHEEPAPVGKHGVAGTFKYNETVDDNLAFFGGGEEIHFQPLHGGGRELLFRS